MLCLCHIIYVNVHTQTTYKVNVYNTGNISDPWNAAQLTKIYITLDTQAQVTQI